MVPRVFFYPRESRNLKEMAAWASENEFTHIMVLGERNKTCHRLLLSVLPEGPTALFKLTNILMGKEIYNHGSKTDHLPELVLNNFSTRLGHRVGRFLGSLFPHRPEFEGRTACTFHNQRDFIFVRHHRYAFDDAFKKVALQELGPSFTIKLMWLATGALDRQHGEYEFLRSKGEEKSKTDGNAGRAFNL
jgi:ribosome production factor 1